MNTSQFDNAKQPTFTSLYYALLPEVCLPSPFSRSDRVALKHLVWGWLLLASGILLVVLRADAGVSAKELLSGGIILFAFSLALIEVFSVSYLLLFGMVANVPDLARVVAARLLSITEHPYGQNLGLGRDEVQALRRIAAVERASADWRGNIVTVLFVLLGFTGLSTMLRSLSTNVDLAESVVRLWGHEPLVAGAIIALVLLLLRALFRFLGSYLANEVANRIIGLACEEALALLEILELPGPPLNAKERRLLALRLDCCLTNDLDPSSMSRCVAQAKDPQTGITWHLVSKERPGPVARLRLAHSDLAERLRRPRKPE